MIAFAMAAQASEIGEDEDVVDVPIGNKVFKARRPTVAQFAYLENAQSSRNLGVVYKLLHSLLGKEATLMLENAILDRLIDFGDLLGGGTELNPDMGLIDQIFEEFKIRPTQPSSDSATSQPTVGRKSARRSPGKGSIPSDSPSPASSTASTSSPSKD